MFHSYSRFLSWNNIKSIGSGKDTHTYTLSYLMFNQNHFQSLSKTSGMTFTALVLKWRTGTSQRSCHETIYKGYTNLEKQIFLATFGSFFAPHNGVINHLPAAITSFKRAGTPRPLRSKWGSLRRLRKKKYITGHL